MQRQNLIGTKVIHAAQSIHVDRDAIEVPTGCGNFASQTISSPWTGDAVDCKGCIRGINAAHHKALILNDLVREGVAHAEDMLAKYGEDNFNSVSTDAELSDMLKLQREWLAADLDLAFENMNVATTRKSITARATLVVLYAAELAFRAELHAADRARAQEAKAGIPACKTGCRLVHDVVEAERIAHQLNEPAPMVTENNYGEQGSCRCPATYHHLDCPQRPKPTGDRPQQSGPFHFTEHPHDQVRAQRYDSIINTLTEMVANANRPVPTTEELIDAILGLEHGEAIEEDRARFPHESFRRFDIPLGVNHRLDDGTVERVWMVGSDVSRRVYPQNMVLITRDNGMVQAVAEGTLVS